MFFRTGYNYDVDAVSRETALSCPAEDDRTKQSFKEECDINTIVRRFGLVGTLPETFKAPLVGDFTHVTDFHSAMNAVVEAKDAFMQLPAAMRRRFDHDPASLMKFLDDPRNLKEARELGLVRKQPEVPRDVVKAVDELAAKLVPRETK